MHQTVVHKRLPDTRREHEISEYDCGEDALGFKFKLVDRKTFGSDHLLYEAFSQEFLPRLNRDENSQMALMQLTALVRLQTGELYLQSRMSIPEIFQPAINRVKNSIAYESCWQRPLQRLFHTLCGDCAKEPELFPKFEDSVNNILTNNAIPMNVEKQTITAVNEASLKRASPAELLQEFKNGNVDPRSVIILNSIMLAYSNVLNRKLDTLPLAS